METIKKVVTKHMYVVDSETGEIVNDFTADATIEVPHKRKASGFFFGFLHPTAMAYKLSGSVFKLLYFVMLVCRKEANTFSVDKLFYDEFAKMLDLSPARIKQMVHDAERQGALIRVVKGKYMVHPGIFWIGSLKDRAKTLEHLLVEQASEKI